MRRTVEEAGDLVARGGVVAAPTETFYALVASAHDPGALERIFAVKGRSSSKALPVIAADRESVESAFDVPELCRVAMEAFWPGPLTLVLRPKDAQLDHLKSEFGTVAVRVSPNLEITKIAKLAGGLVTSTSANLSGEPAVTSPSGLSVQLVDGIDGVVDGGETPGGLASTIVEWRDGGWFVYREGPISLADLEALVRG